MAAFLTEFLTEEERRSIAILSFNQWEFALAGVVEIALGARDFGSEVSVALWADKTPVHDSGWATSHTLARICGSAAIDAQVQKALESSGFSPSQFPQPPIRRWNPAGLPDIPRGITRSQVRQLTYKGAPLGRAILQVHPDFKTPFREDYVWPRRWVKAAAQSFAWVFDQTRALIDRESINTIVVFNGRFLHDNAAAAAARSMGVRVLYGETGGIETDFDLTTASTHEMDHVQHRMLRMYSTWPDPQPWDKDKNAISRTWFLNRQTHVDPEVQLFVGGQEFGELGAVSSIDPADRVVVFFSSSGDEIAELELDWNQFFQSQENALAVLAEQCRARPATTLVVRTHPHLRIKPANDLERWVQAVERAGVDIHIGPESDVDSYALMKRADVVVTYGSTSGVEAAFLERPSVLMGPSSYSLLNCVTPVSTITELNGALDQSVVQAQELSYPYGLFLHRRGFTFDYLQRSPSGQLILGDNVIGEASEIPRKLSHMYHRIKTSWLTNK